MLQEPTVERQTIERIAYKDRAQPDHLDALLYLGIEHDDMYDQIKMNRMKDVLDFAYSFEDGLDVIRRVVLKVDRKDRVDRAWEYMKMRKEHLRRSDAVRQMEESTKGDREALADLERHIGELER